MKRITRAVWASGLLATLATGCQEQHTTYSDAEYVMFADTASVNRVLQDQDYFSVPIASTTACDYDRHFGIEILDNESNAIEGRHYRLLSNTVTIEAGRRTAEVRIRGNYEQFGPTDTMNVVLRLLMPEQLKWDLYGDRTNVKMVKSCPFEIDDFIRIDREGIAGPKDSGWCMVTSMFLNSYPGIENKSIQRLVRTEKHPTEPHTLILHDWLFTGYDVTVRFHVDDPAEPRISMDRDQVLSDEESVFGQINGDNKILVTSSPNQLSYFGACEHFITLWALVYVEDLGQSVGTVGNFYHLMEWISPEEAKRLQIEEGM